MKLSQVNTDVETKTKEQAQLAEKLQSQITSLEQQLEQSAQREKEATQKKQVIEKKMEQLNETYQQEKQQLAAAVKEELEKEKNKAKFALELDYQTKNQNIENELRRSMTAVRDDSDQMKLKQVEIDRLREKQSAIALKHQKALMGLLQAQQQVSQLKQEFAAMTTAMKGEMVWGRVGPKPPLIMAVVEKIQQVGTLEKAYRGQNEQLKAMLQAANQKQ